MLPEIEIDGLALIRVFGIYIAMWIYSKHHCLTELLSFGNVYTIKEYMYMMTLRACQLIGIVCTVTLLDLIKQPVSVKRKRANAQKEMRKTLGYLYQETSLQPG